ncbi:SRPBCC family protein [Geodermatophilus sp. DSM 44513]|uniref:SRPBCC family protein n=1 Tax=Geodermatophilus sp. DSM 44513 TaxID=1528104 RepID=UPI001288B938|nr:SRPBCC family protein [Geodermatophilus sp. DSM 44513]WNV76540.1 SRPBCC family protein [Geodermatophilus sp. DSM 44513]
MTTKVEKSIQVDVPVNQAYNQWTQFEDFPHFMGGVKEVRQLTDQRMHWVAEIAGVRREWEAAVLEQEPDRKVAWAATSGATNAGAVRFEEVGPMSTIVYLSLEYEPEGVVEQVGDKLGIVERQVTSDLERFKRLIEDEGYATGAWRGSVNEHLDVGTPGVGDAVGSHGDDGKAGVSGKAVAAGVAAVAGVAAAAAAVASSSSTEEERPLPPPPPQPEGVVQPETVTVVEQPPADVVRDSTLTEEAPPAGYTAPSSTEGVERGVREGGDDPMIGGGSR